MNKNILLKIGYLCGLVPLIIGMSIFFTWWIARAWFAIDINSLEPYGILWIIISVPIAIIGLLIIFYFLIKNYKDKLKLKLSIGGLFIILINIPSVYWILNKQADLDRRAYIKFYNNTKNDNIELIIKGSDFSKKIGSFDDSESIVDYYYPKYLSDIHESVPIVDIVMLLVKSKLGTKILILPAMYKGECRNLYLNKEFKLLEKLK
jgi:hypothetical protein